MQTHLGCNNVHTPEKIKTVSVLSLLQLLRYYIYNYIYMISMICYVPYRAYKISFQKIQNCNCVVRSYNEAFNNLICFHFTTNLCSKVANPHLFDPQFYFSNFTFKVYIYCFFLYVSIVGIPLFLALYIRCAYFHERSVPNMFPITSSQSAILIATVLRAR